MYIQVGALSRPSLIRINGEGTVQILIAKANPNELKTNKFTELLTIFQIICMPLFHSLGTPTTANNIDSHYNPADEQLNRSIRDCHHRELP